jgi:hypothetical protein
VIDGWAIKALVVHWECWRLRWDYERLRGLDERIRHHRNEPIPAYRRYASDVSIPTTAQGRVLGAFLMALCELLMSAFLVGLGSVFSWFVLWSYAARVRPSPSVWSLDDNWAWLASTGRFLLRERIPLNNICGLLEFWAIGRSGFNLILHGLGMMQVRVGTVGRVLRLAAPGAFVVPDDMHPADETLRRAVRDHESRYSSIRLYARGRGVAGTVG